MVKKLKVLAESKKTTLSIKIFLKNYHSALSQNRSFLELQLFQTTSTTKRLDI